MNDEVAVLVDRNGELATLYDSYQTVVHKKKDRWLAVRTMNFCLYRDMQPAQLRAQISQLIAFLNPCRIFMIRAIGGLPYFEMEKHGIRIWEMEGYPEHLMQPVMEEELACAPRVSAVNEPAGIKEVLPGYLQISLREVQLQGSSHGLSSKQILLPILNKGDFQTLEILCDHVPPWLEVMLLNQQIDGRIVQSHPGRSKVVIMSPTS